ncbi:histidine phosphatase family protein [Streptomyces sp. AF1A]|jgi:broad specificity phosphatase PhoE|uniref:histidine phosphatase family protein n=1 Tax=Streptomyces sp. AF1A TaxID=3394350 RepID=UPI0039BC230C
MTNRLTLLCARPADTVFADAPLRERKPSGTGVARAPLPPHSSAIRSPSSDATLTAAALGLRAVAEPALRDLDHGAWSGRAVADIAAADPYGYSAWLTDPDAAPHGGETVRELCRRTAQWLGSLPAETGSTLAVVEPAVAQALLVNALAEPVRAFWRLRMAPLHTVSLTRRGGVWSVQPAEASADSGLAPYSSLSITALAAAWHTISEQGTRFSETRAA